MVSCHCVDTRNSGRGMPSKWLGAASSAFLSAVLVASSLSAAQGHSAGSSNAGVHRHQPAFLASNTRHNVRHRRSYPGTSVLASNPSTHYPSERLAVPDRASCRTRGIEDTPPSGAHSSTSVENESTTEGKSGTGVTRPMFVSMLASSALLAAATLQPAGSLAAAGRRSIEEVKKDVEADFVQRRYYITGDLTPSLYRPDCLFTDPTTRVASVERYTAAVKLLFDPDNAQVDLLSMEVKDDNHLFAKWRLQGYLKFPWHPYVAPYTGTTLYTVGDDGLISRHEETWSISALDAARATVTPTAGPPAVNPA